MEEIDPSISLAISSPCLGSMEMVGLSVKLREPSMPHDVGPVTAFGQLSSEPPPPVVWNWVVMPETETNCGASA